MSDRKLLFFPISASRSNYDPRNTQRIPVVIIFAFLDYVGGLSAFLSVSFEDRYFFETEYVGAIEAFKESRNFEPKMWNFD